MDAVEQALLATGAVRSLQRKCNTIVVIREGGGPQKLAFTEDGFRHRKEHVLIRNRQVEQPNQIGRIIADHLNLPRPARA